MDAVKKQSEEIQSELMDISIWFPSQFDVYPLDSHSSILLLRGIHFVTVILSVVVYHG